MLRTALLVVALGLLAVGLGAWLGGSPSSLPLLVWGAVLAAAVLLERWRYRSNSAARASEFQATDERFIDPESGTAMQVLFNPRTGERRYLPLPPGNTRPR